MTVWFVSRHPGAREWARNQDLAVDRWCEHLDVNQVAPGDTVIGTLPVPMVASACRRGGCYWHLAIDLPFELRGKELSMEMLQALSARLELYRVIPVNGTQECT